MEESTCTYIIDHKAIDRRINILRILKLNIKSFKVIDYVKLTNVLSDEVKRLVDNELREGK